MDKVTIRAAESADLDAIIPLVAAAYAPARAELDDLPDVTAGFTAHLEDDIVLVAETGSGVAGVIVLSLRADGLWVVNLAVSPDAAGQGIGQHLMRRAEDEARQRDLAEMRLRTHAGMARTIAFYQRLGWEETDRSGAILSMHKSLTDTR